ncbi:MAG: hypothetical protein AAGA93_26235 [Actinomycetota bacterium]
MDDPGPPSPHSRRTFLAGALAVLAAACSSSSDETPTADDPGPDSTGDTTSADTTSDATSATGDETTDDEAGGDPSVVEALTAASFAAVSICALAPATTAGPFPTLDELDRRDITEGYPGHPLRLGIRVVDGACEPIPGARVEIWHTDASGDYSSYTDGGSGKDEGEGTTFLRGSQVAGDDGIVEFQTIYPGWYDGRAVHIHVIAAVDGEDLLTSQLYFDEAYTEAVHATGAYAEFGPPDTSRADDGLIGDPTTDGTGIVLVAAPTPLGDGTLGLINLAVDA